MITNADITIYNRRYDPETRLDTWKGTVIKNVSFYSDMRVNLDNKGLSTADIYKIRIPGKSLKGYVPADEYAADEGTWTVQKDDYIVLGASDQEIARPIDLKNSLRINSWSDNRRGSLPHIRIGGF